MGFDWINVLYMVLGFIMVLGTIGLLIFVAVIYAKRVGDKREKQ